MPRVSVVIPAYRASQTLDQCLASLSVQTVEDFELVLVESGPDAVGESVLALLSLQAIYLYVPEMLLPHRALNLGLANASGEILAFLDSDAYAAPDWLEKHVIAHEAGHSAVAGAVDSFGRGWLALGSHLAKFDKWLDGLPPHAVDEAPTDNRSVSRSVLEAVGPFDESTVHGDTDFCWRWRQLGGEIWFDPGPVVKHHAIQSWWDLFTERFWRGWAFSHFLAKWPHVQQRPKHVQAALSLLPFRLLSQMVRIGQNARSASLKSVFLVTIPITAGLVYAWLWGEGLGAIRLWESRA